jgi:uncharacterized protein YeaC (DUF1315 family)
MTQTVRVVQEVDTVPLQVVTGVMLALEQGRNPNGMPLTTRQMQYAVRAALQLIGVGD